MGVQQGAEVELLRGPLDGFPWRLVVPQQDKIVVPRNYFGPNQPVRRVCYVRGTDGKFRYDPHYGE